MDFNSNFSLWQAPLNLSFTYPLMLEPSDNDIRSQVLFYFQNLTEKNKELETELEYFKKENTKLIEKLKRNRPKRKYSQRRTDLLKDFMCPFEGCSSKYSSRIALNLHLKKKHSSRTNDN